MKKIFLIGMIILALLSISVLTVKTVSAATTGVTDISAGQAVSIGLVNQDPDPAVAGNTFDVRLSVENQGGSSTGDILVSIVPTFPFEEVSGEPLVQDLGPLSAFQSGSNVQIVKYRLKISKDATEGTYYLTAKYTIVGGTSNISATTLLAVNVRNTQSVEIIHIDKTVLIPGQQSSLKFVINNVGSAPLRDLTFSWSNSAQVVLPVGSDNTRYISYLDVGASTEVEYQVIADTTVVAGLYPLNLVLKYASSSGTPTTINTIAGVYVGGSTDFDVAFSDSSTGTTSFTIANIGSNPATSVSVSIPEQRGWRVTGTNSMIIGNLNKGDYTVASFKLSSQAASLGNRTGGRNMNYSTNSGNSASGSTNLAGPVGANSLIMQIAYTDTMGLRTIVNKTINIGSQTFGLGNQTATGGAYSARGTATKSSGISITWYIVGAIVLIVAGLLVYRRYSKQKLLNSNVKIKDVFKTKKK